MKSIGKQVKSSSAFSRLHRKDIPNKCRKRFDFISCGRNEH